MSSYVLKLNGYEYPIYWFETSFKTQCEKPRTRFKFYDERQEEVILTGDFIKSLGGTVFKKEIETKITWTEIDI